MKSSLFSLIVLLLYSSMTQHTLGQNPSSDKETQGIDLPEMVFVKGGRFLMGSNYQKNKAHIRDNATEHLVFVSDFYIGRYEVTQKLWKTLMANNPSSLNEFPDHPVESVSWYEVRSFIIKLNQISGKNYLLPTEAEWEYAARGGDKSKGYKYSGSNSIHRVAWYFNNCKDQTWSVGKKKANELGIYDMTGNVLEWCSDWYANYQDSIQYNPQGPSRGKFRVCRGGSAYDEKSNCLITTRYSASPVNRNGGLGFRLVLSSME